MAILVGFLLLTRMSGGSADEETAAPSSEAAATGETVAPPAGEAATGTAPPAEPAEPAVPGEREAPSAEAAAAAGKFVAGPVLPTGLVSAYARGETPVLLVNRVPPLSGAADHRLGAIV